jgi:hypothetical protein
MNDYLRQIDDFVHNLFRGQVDYARDRATYEGASAVERATFGKIFNFIEGIVVIVMLFGCFMISNAVQNQTFLLYLCGLLWIIPFLALTGLLARFRRSLFVRVRGIMGRFLGG